MPQRLNGRDVNGLDYLAGGGGGAGGKDFMTREFRFDLPPVMITSLELQTRAYTKHVSVKNMTLDPAKPHVSQISTETLKQ